jgi:predicted transcriptional regulator of viral defense system
MAISRFSIARKDIIKFFNDTSVRIFKYREIALILKQNIDNWRLAKATTVAGFIKQLKSTNMLNQYNFKFPNYKISLYVWGDQLPDYPLISNINKDAFFSHFSAMFLHNLTDQTPKSIYLNVEQTPKPVYKNKLIQKNIDLAFSRKPRITNNFATFRDYRINMLNGKHTAELGIIDITLESDMSVRITNLERTLIDIAVRPAYSGGVHQVLNAYKNASNNVSVNKLCSYLKKLDYTYPYHQAIGFYLTRSGVYNETQINLLKKFQIENDFYLTHNIQEKEYSKEWSLYYPKGF